MLFWIWKKDLIKLLKIYRLQARICWGLPGSAWKLRWSSKQWPEITGNLYTYLFPILQQKKQKPITNSCINNLRSKPILILSKTSLLRKKPVDEAFRVLLRSLRRGWDQTLADFNRFSNTETRSCYSCLVNGQFNIYFSKSIVNCLFSVDLEVWGYATLLILWFINFKLRNASLQPWPPIWFLSFLL